eukprot:m.72771 g.72771  ORF g.72771 m.72771 type:complete len:745 (-) comp10155_c0_seq1:106-2340(-)
MTSFSHGYGRRLDDTSAPSWGGDLMDTQSILAHVDRLIASKRGEWESRIQLAASEADTARGQLRETQNQLQALRDENSGLKDRLTAIDSKTRELTHKYETRIRWQDEQLNAFTRYGPPRETGTHALRERLAALEAENTQLRAVVGRAQSSHSSVNVGESRIDGGGGPQLAAAVAERDAHIARLKRAASAALLLNERAMQQSRLTPPSSLPSHPPNSFGVGSGTGAVSGGDGGGSGLRDDEVAAQLAVLVSTGQAQHDRIAELEAHEAELTEWVDRANRRAEELESQNAELSKRLAAAAAPTHPPPPAPADAGHADEIRRLKEAVVDLEAANNDDLARAALERQGLEDQVAALTATVAEQEARIAAAAATESADRAAARERVGELERKAHELQARLRDAETAVATRGEQSGELILKLHAEVAQLREDKVELVQGVAAHTAAAESLRAEWGEVVAELTQSNTELKASLSAELQAQAARHRDAVAVVRTESAAATAAVTAELKAAHSSAAAERSTLLAQIESARADATADAAELEALLESARADARRKEAELEATQAEAKAKAAELEAQLESTRADAQTEVTELKTQLESAQAEVAGLRAAGAEWGTEVTALQQSFAEARDKLLALEEAHQAVVIERDALLQEGGFFEGADEGELQPLPSVRLQVPTDEFRTPQIGNPRRNQVDTPSTGPFGSEGRDAWWAPLPPPPEVTPADVQSETDRFLQRELERTATLKGVMAATLALYPKPS